MLILVAATRRPLPRGRSLTGAAVYGAVGFAASFGFAYTGLRDVPAGTAMVLIALTPLLTFGLAIAHGQERFHAQGLYGALIALAGIGIIFLDQLSANVPLVPLLFVLAAAAAIAESAVLLKGIPRSDPFATNAVAMLTGGGLLLALSLVTGEPIVLPRQADTWAAVGYLVLFGSVVMFALFLYALQRWTASAVSYVTLLMPLVTVALAAVLTDERVTPSFVLGGAVILSGVYVGAFLQSRPARSSATSSPECLPIDECAEVEAEPARA
jgi:drug/metabolite transporter (DMT)-like permease